jgi:hypothetical protein
VLQDKTFEIRTGAGEHRDIAFATFAKILTRKEGRT